MELLWFLLITINGVICLKYFHIISDRYATDVNDSFPSDSLVKIRKTCMENDCKAFCCKTDDNCYIVSDNWSDSSVYNVGSKIYSAKQTCKNDPCSSDETCSTLPFVKSDDKQYTCCPKYNCGDNCEIENFIASKDVDLPQNSLKEHKVEGPELKTLCLDHCFRDTACASVLLYRSKSTDSWICDTKVTSHRYVNLIANPETGDKEEVTYFYRTRTCERNSITCNNLLCDAEQTCVDNKRCCPKFKCGKDCNDDNFQVFSHKDMQIGDLKDMVLSGDLVTSCKQFCVSDTRCNSIVMVWRVHEQEWRCITKTTTHLIQPLFDLPDNEAYANVRYFYRTRLCE